MDTSSAVMIEHDRAGWRGRAIAIIKLVHSAIFLVNSAAILHIFWAGVRNRPSRWTGPALAAALIEVMFRLFSEQRSASPLAVSADCGD